MLPIAIGLSPVELSDQVSRQEVAVGPATEIVTLYVVLAGVMRSLATSARLEIAPFDPIDPEEDRGPVSVVVPSASSAVPAAERVATIVPPTVAVLPPGSFTVPLTVIFGGAASRSVDRNAIE